MEDPSTIRSAVADMGGAPYGGDSLAGQTAGKLSGNRLLLGSCTSFVLCSQYVLFGKEVLAPFDPSSKLMVPFDFWGWPLLKGPIPLGGDGTEC
jgi:hypothetical protein